MARARKHKGCPGALELAYFKVAYIRESDPARFVAIGFYCAACKAFQPKL